MPFGPRRSVGLLILLTLLARIGWAAALEPTNDESYHWLYAVHPDLSFFDHPPMTMWVEQVGLTLCGGWVHPLSLRLGFLLLFAGSTWILFRWTADWFGEHAGFWAAVALNLSGYFTAFGGVFALPDSPFLFFALLTFWRATAAVQSNSLKDWLGVGIGFAGAMLSKYHAVLLPAGVVFYALVTPNKRKLLWSPGPYLAVLIGFLGFSPVIVWNAQHEWASFLFQGGRARSEEVTPFLHTGPLKWFGGPILYLLPWIWFWLVVELVRHFKRFRSLADPERILICLCVVPLGFFFLISGLSNDVLLHWPLVGFLPLYPLLGRNWVRLRGVYPRLSKWFLGSWIVLLIGLAGFILIQARFGVIAFPAGTKDPSADVSGWESVAQELRSRGITDEPNSYLFTNCWYDSGQLAFATRNKLPVACLHDHDARGFSFWSRPEDYLGKTGYFVVPDATEEEQLRREYEKFFGSFELVAEFTMQRGGHAFRPIRVFRCSPTVKPYPFEFKSPKK